MRNTLIVAIFARMTCRPATAFRGRFSPPLKVAILVLWWMVPAWLYSQTISGTIQDSSGALIAGARIEISGGDLLQPLVLSSDALGKFASPDLKPGTYSVRVTGDGFEPLIKTLDLHGPLQLQLTLTIAKEKVTISVAGKSLAFANSDPVYRQLRQIGLGQTFRLDTASAFNHLPPQSPASTPPKAPTQSCPDPASYARHWKSQSAAASPPPEQRQTQPAPEWHSIAPQGS